MKQTALGQKILNSERSAAGCYRDFAVGKPGLLPFLKYEFYHFFLAPLPGALGLALRRLFLPLLLGEAGSGVVVGCNVTFRHPHKIFLGNRVVIDDGAVLDAKGEENDGIRLGDQVVVGRNTILSCKGDPPGGSITVGLNTNIAMNCLIHAEEEVEIGENVLFAAYVYIVGGGNHEFERTDIPIIEQPSINKGGVVIEKDVWLGAGVTVLDGVRVGRGSVLGAGAVINKDVPAYSVSVGVPARVIRSRKEGKAPL